MEEDVYYKGYKIKVRQDEDYESPNDWGDEDLFLVYNHRQFTVKRDGFDPNDIYDYLELQSKINSLIGLDETQEELEDNLKGYFDYESEYWVFPVEAYIHSGVSLSLFSGTKQCRWDSSVSGYILASKEEFEDLETATNGAEGLIKTWNQYLSGDVWGYIIEKSNTVYSISKEKFDRLLFENDLSTLESEFDIENNWTEVDSCWGFYGEDAAIDEAKLIIDNEYNNLNK
jgi:hypothetical protein